MKDIAIDIFYEKQADGRYNVSSDEVPGLFLSSLDFDALQEDLTPVVKELLFHNMGFAVESIRWVPTPEDARKALDKPPEHGHAHYIARLKAA